MAQGASWKHQGFWIGTFCYRNFLSAFRRDRGVQQVKIHKIWAQPRHSGVACLKRLHPCFGRIAHAKLPRHGLAVAVLVSIR